MTNLEKYNQAYVECFGIAVEDAPQMVYAETAVWDSVGHMSLIAALEDAFSIMIDTDDIIDLSSYEKGMEILRKYDVEI